MPSNTKKLTCLSRVPQPQPGLGAGALVKLEGGVAWSPDTNWGPKSPPASAWNGLLLFSASGSGVLPSVRAQ